MSVPFTINRLARVVWLTSATATKPRTFQDTIEPDRLATAPAHSVASAELVLLQCRPAQVVITHRLELLTLLWNALTRHFIITTPLATVSRLAPAANQEVSTSTLSNRMVRRDQSHLNECFPPQHRQPQAAIIIYTRMVETLHRFQHLPIRTITEAAAIDQWSPGRSRCAGIPNRMERTASAFASKVAEKLVSRSRDKHKFIKLMRLPLLDRHWCLHFPHRGGFCSRAIRPPARRHHPRGQRDTFLRNDSWRGTHGKWNVVWFLKCACETCQKPIHWWNKLRSIFETLKVAKYRAGRQQV